MHHFFADPTQVAEDTIFITGPDVNHMKHVLRMKPGEEVLISDGTGRDYTCEVEAFEPDRAVVRIHSVCDSPDGASCRDLALSGPSKSR